MTKGILHPGLNLIYLYPSNKTENLLAIANKIQQVSPLPVFSKEVFVVQNAGMQHWLNMSLAEQAGICFNLGYALPAQFLWKVIRTLVLPENMVDQEPFSREALSWRIYEILASKAVVDDVDFRHVNQYWQGTVGSQDHLKRYQLSCQMADLYEQYLVFRPEWIEAWQQGKGHQEFSADEYSKIEEQWQRKLWNIITKDQTYSPIELIEQAIVELPNNHNKLPKRISFFGINSMAPMWLSFINQLSQYTDVHFYHLNPCVSYWGDIVSEKQAITMLNKWTDNLHDISQSVGNPLLANLGQQGREFLSMLQQYSTVDIEAFTNVQSGLPKSATVLSCIQNDILTLSDRRSDPVTQKDESIVISSAHTPLREVQGLHDWLLHQFNDDPTLTPKDVLVMCPQIEDYAPYVNAVFSRGWQEISDDVPPLPCSIADRVAKDSDPIVIAFSELLVMPDSRFHINQVISWLKVSAVQDRFALASEDIEKISLWIKHSAIHWGLDAQHKNHELHVDNSSTQFTWENGFSRLLEGLAFSDTEDIFDEKLLVPVVEGQDMVLLGTIMEIIETLQLYRAKLSVLRSPEQWHELLTQMVKDLFDDSYDSISLIVKAVDGLLEFTANADFKEEISLQIVREFLTNHFSQPDPGRQFMIGQVTFCSMLPMRSIPFKVIAVLGLNDGVFPRIRMPMGFDLMSKAQAKLGDRSRRGDDRYLFLEAILSARDTLYLSYQGRNIKNNQEKQPSLVLNELLEYLHLGYGWQCFGDNYSDIYQLPMQAHSKENFIGRYAGFDEKWLSIALSLNKETIEESTHSNADISVEADYDQILSSKLSLDELIRFFIHPSKVFAQKQMALFLEQPVNELEDAEPFVADHLSKYLLKQRSLINMLNADSDSTIETVSAYWQNYARLSGNFSSLPAGRKESTKLIEDSESLYRHIQERYTGNIVKHHLSIALDLQCPDDKHRTIKIDHQFSTIGENIVFVRSSTPKAKDYLQMFLTLSFVELAKEQGTVIEKDQAIDTKQVSGFYFNSKSQEMVNVQLVAKDKAILAKFLMIFLEGHQQPKLLNADLALAMINGKKFEQDQLIKYWSDDNQMAPFGQDPYIKYFWPHCPNIEDIRTTLYETYLGVFSAFSVEKES